MSDQGWIKLYRKIQSSFVWTNSDQLKLWLLILMKANHSKSKFLFNGQEIVVSSGQMVTGRDALAFEFNQGVTRDHQIVARTLWRWIKYFENQEMLSIKSTSKYSVITVIGWGEYQEGDQQVSITRPSSVHHLSTNKNDKNEEKKPSGESKGKIGYKKIIDYLNQQTGRSFHDTESNRKLIRARINDGFTEHDFALVIWVKSAQWKSSEMEKYLKPGTLFAPSHFDDYLNEAKDAKRKQQRGNTPEPRGLTPEEGSARSADYMAKLEEKYKRGEI